MKTEEVFAETGRIGNEVIKIKKYLEKLNKRSKKIMDICPHEIVFKYNDNHPRKMMVDGNYFCPACGKTIRCIHSNDIKKSDFKKSRIIPLLDLSLVASKETYFKIREEVYYNMDYYYNPEVDVEDQSYKMEKELEDLQSDYNKKSRGLTKRI